MKMTKRSVAIMLMMICGTALAAPGKIPAVGDEAPGFMLRDREGAMVSLNQMCGAKVAEANRKVVVLDFFQTTCKPCIEELPALKRFHAKWKDDARVKFYMIGVGESAEKLTAFATQYGLDIPMLADPFLVAGKAYGALTFPTTVIIDRDKKITFFVGKKLENIEAVLNENVMKAVGKPK